VENALKLAPAATDVILVHDAVRPFIRLKDLSRIIEAILRHGAAALAIPEVDTLRRVTGDVFQDTVDRKGLPMKWPFCNKPDLPYITSQEHPTTLKSPPQKIGNLPVNSGPVGRKYVI